MRAPEKPGSGGQADALLGKVGGLMRECHGQAIALQSALSRITPASEETRAHLEAFQHLDHLTQVFDDLARLLPALGDALSDNTVPVDHLSARLKLKSLRSRLFSPDDVGAGPIQGPGDVRLF